MARHGITMQSARELLEEIAGNRKGLLTLRPHVMGAAGKVHRHRAKLAAELVMAGLAIWANPQHTTVKITFAGRQNLKD